MSVILKGMEMPKNCSECRMWSICTCLNDFEDYESICYAVDDGDLVRDKNCPLVEIPTPHGRLGDLDALVKDLAVYRGGHNEGYGFDGGMYEAYNNSIELVEEAPTAIEAEGEKDGR